MSKLLSFSKTKCLGYFISISATIYGFQFGEPNTMQMGWVLGAVLVGGRHVTENIKQIKLGEKIKLKDY